MVKRDVSELPLDFITDVAEEKGGRIEIESAPRKGVTAYLVYRDCEDCIYREDCVMKLLRHVDTNELARNCPYYEDEKVDEHDKRSEFMAGILRARTRFRLQSLTQAGAKLVIRNKTRGFKYPLSVTRCRYVTKVGGRSRALAEDRVGLHIEALQQNTDLYPEARVLLDSTDKGSGGEAFPPKPLFLKSTFRIDPLRGVRESQLMSMSSNGEAVLPHGAKKGLKTGDEIILNSAVNRIPEGWIVKRIQKQAEG